MFPLEGTIIVVYLLSLFALIFTFLAKILHQNELPPGPPRLPILGNLHQVGNNMSNFRRLAKKYGGLLSLQAGSARTVVVSSPDIAKEIFESHDLVFSGRPRLCVAEKLSYGCSNIAFASPSSHWNEFKKMAIVELLSMKKVRSFHAIRDEEISAMVESVYRSSEAVDVSQVALAMTNNITCRAVFGTVYHSNSHQCHLDGNKRDDEKQTLQELLLETQVLLAEFNVADFYPWLGSLLNKVSGFNGRLERVFGKLDGFFQDVIDQHLQPTRHEPRTADLLDVLLRVQRDSTQHIKLTNNHIKAILLDMFIAGTDPTWGTLVWSMVQLIKHPLAMKKAQEEVRGAAKGKAKIEEEDLRNLIYLKWVINETLRLHPPNPFPRETTKECIINGFKVPKKTRVFIDAKTIGRDEKYWENPNAFEPERFERCSMESVRNEHCYMPFGIGRRGCPGRNFGMVVMELALANMLYRFDWALPAGVTTDAVDMAEAVGLTTHKTVPLVLVATPWTNYMLSLVLSEHFQSSPNV